MDSHSATMWERRPDETEKSYSAFLAYIEMPIRDIGNPENSRSLPNLTRKLGYAAQAGKAASTLEDWSAKYSWVERARAYDSHNSQLVIKVKDASLAQFQHDLILKRTEQTVLMNEALNKQLIDLLTRQSAGVEVDSLELLRTVNALKQLDDLERRIAGLPTNFNTQVIDDEEDMEERVYMVGKSRHE